MMEYDIKVAPTAGFCYGVDRAVDIVYGLVNAGEKTATLGPIIHNPQIVADLKSHGVLQVKTPIEIPKDYTVVIRSHGVEKSVIDALRRLGIKYLDATCPFVKKIHGLAERAAAEGAVFIFAGDADHGEVQGVIGHSSGEHYVVKNPQEIEQLFKKSDNFAKRQVFLAAQTTYNTELWRECLKTLKKLCTNPLVFDTICNATVKRQTEAKTLAQGSDCMIVVGGRESSNTAKLCEICSEYCTTYLVESADLLPKLEENGKDKLRIGITAGASTPASIIKEVLVTMSDVNQNAEQNFEEMLEESLKSLNTDEKVRGVVVGISPTEVYVDVGRKQAGFIPVGELSQDPNAKPGDLVKIGDEIELLIMKTNDQEGTIMLSKRRVDAMKGWDKLEEASLSQEIFSGKVIEAVKGGVIVLKDAIRVFIPASQATLTRGEDLNALVNTEVKFRIIEVNRQRRRAVGSIRSVLREEKKVAEEKLWSEIAVGQRYTGKVKSLTSFGAFVDLGGVDGMVHISELSWNRIKHPSEVLTVGDMAEVFVKSVDPDSRKISLGYKDPSDNPWEKLKIEYPVGTECEVTIVGMTPFGAFANVLPGIDGLIHISQIANRRIEKPQDVLKVGDKVQVRITDIDFEKHRVSLSIRILLEEQEAENDKAAAEGSAEAVVYVAAPEEAKEPAEEVPETADEDTVKAEEPADESEA